MINRLELEGAIKVSGFTMKEIANELDIDISTLHRKINGTSDFYREEIKILCDLLKIKDPKPIFFDD